MRMRGAKKVRSCSEKRVKDWPDCLIEHDARSAIKWPGKREEREQDAVGSPRRSVNERDKALRYRNPRVRGTAHQARRQKERK